MATSKKFSELPAASSVGNGDLFAIAHEDALAETGYVSQKLTAAQAGQKVNGDTEYPTSLPSFPANGQNPFAALEKLNSDIIGLYPVNTASGSIATFSTSLALPLVAMSAEIVAQQASGTPTPSNPLPISGFNSIELTHEYGESESETKTIALGQTVYGGSVDCIGGSGSKAFDIADFSNLVKNSASATDWIYYSRQSNFNVGRRLDTLCSHFPRGGLSTPATWTNNNTIIYFNLDGVIGTNDVTTAKAYLANIQFVYPLATPIEITGLTPANFTTFAGEEQNIFADSGDISVSFKQGIQEYIDAKIAETQALIL